MVSAEWRPVGMRSTCRVRGNLYLQEGSQGPVQMTLDRLLPHDVDWACYDEHRQICPLQPVSLYSGWIRCGHIKVWYLPKRVLHQFGYVQTILRPLAHFAAVATTDGLHVCAFHESRLNSSWAGNPCSTSVVNNVWLYDVVYEDFASLSWTTASRGSAQTSRAWC
jgi:hypothetical protein